MRSSYYVHLRASGHGRPEPTPLWSETTTVERTVLASCTSDTAHGCGAGSERDQMADVRQLFLVGELDLRSGLLVTRSCLAGTESFVVVDISGVTFMDCCGYGAIAAARGELLQHGRTLTIVAAAGQPAHLLELLDALSVA